MTAKKVVVANHYILADENGDPRAGLSMSGNEPHLMFTDTNGKIRAALDVAVGHPTALQLYAKNEVSRAILCVLEDGPMLVLSDTKGIPRVTLGVDKFGKITRVAD